MFDGCRIGGNLCAVIPEQARIRFFEFRLFPTNCRSVGCLDSRLRGNDGILGFCFLGMTI
ncbi:hypothetical protein COH51_07810 [Neisseria meningitidis]|nr:hypothetical protein COH51_07810 [Neisseria meningitidis]